MMHACSFRKDSDVWRTPVDVVLYLMCGGHPKCDVCSPLRCSTAGETTRPRVQRQRSEPRNRRGKSRHN